MNTQLLSRAAVRSLAIVVAGTLASATFAQLKGVTYVGEAGVVDTVAAMNARSAKESSLLKWVRIPKKTEKAGPDRRNLPQNPNALESPSFPVRELTGGGGAPGGGGRGGIYSPQTIDFQFTGPTLNDSGFVPPDVQGDVSPTQILVGVNGRIRSYDRNGNVGALNVTAEAFFQSVRNNSGISDPRVRWDRLSNRWIVIAINVSSPNRLVVGVSNGATITNTSSFTFYFLTTPSAFADYPTLGVDANALYVGENTFNTSLTAYLGTNVWVIRKSSVLSGGPIVGSRFNTSGSSGAGVFTPQGVDNDDPAATEGYFIGVDNAVFGLLQMRRVSNPGGTPTISGNLSISVPTTAFPLDAQHPGSATRLDALDDRTYNAMIRRNRISGQRTLVTAHNIRINSSGTGTGSGDRTGSRWYEVGNLTGTPSLVQSGTAFDNAASGFLYTWMPSISMSGQGHTAIGVNRANSTTQVQVAAAGRLRTDALGTTQAATLVVQSTSNYAIGGNPFRWGDYSMVVVDPLDDQTMWGFHEFVSSTNVWAVRVFRLRAPAPAAITSLSPNTLAQGASNVPVTVNGSSSGGTEFYDTDVDFPNRLVASFSGTGVTVNSVTWNSPTQATLNVSVSAGATPGGRTLTMTNPDQQQSALANALTINAGGPEVVVPSSFATVLGRLDAGNVGSLAADDDDYLRHCKFIVPNALVAPVRVRVNGTTTKSSTTGIAAACKGRMASGGSFSLGVEQRNFVSGVNQDLATGAVGTTEVTVTSNTTGTHSDMIGAAGALQAEYLVRQTGPSVVSLWCFNADHFTWTVN